MSETAKVIHEVDRWGGGTRYTVESIRDLGGYRYEFRLGTDSKAAAIAHAEKLVHEHEHYKARVLDTREENE